MTPHDTLRAARHDTQLPDKAYRILCDIADLSHERGYCYASNEHFAEVYGISERTVQAYLRVLIKAGYLSRSHGREGRRLRIDNQRPQQIQTNTDEAQESCTHRKNPAPTAENQHPAPAEILHQPQDFNTPGVQDFNTPPRDINTPPEGGGRASAREAPTAPTTGSGRIDEHPAVQEYRRIYPSVEVHWRFLEHIAAKIGTDGPSMDAWTETLLLWHGKDYDPTNVTGLISRWRKVKAEGRTTHHTSPTWEPETPETPYANAVWLKEDYPHVFENAEA